MSLTTDAPTRLVKMPGKGRGLLAARPIRKRELILSCPYLVLGPKSAPQVGTDLEHYVFSFPFTRSGKPYEKSVLTAIVFGDASMLNHSDDANCAWTWNLSRQCHETRALRDIEAGEELTFDYGWDDEVWQGLGGKQS